MDELKFNLEEIIREFEPEEEEQTCIPGFAPEEQREDTRRFKTEGDTGTFSPVGSDISKTQRFAPVEDISFEEITAALNRALPAGLEVMYTASPVMDISECAYATYSIKLDTDMSDDEVRDELSGEMVINKKTKSGYKDVDISEFVKSVSVKDGTVEMTVCAACNRALNPALAVQYLGDRVRSSLITRTGLYNEKMEKFI